MKNGEVEKIRQTKRQRILNSPTKLVEECENSLAALWRIILKDLNIDEAKWNLLMGVYLTDPVNNFSNDSRILGDIRGNLNKALCSNKVQMLIFNRALRFLQTERVTLTFNIYSSSEDDCKPETYDINILYGNENGIQLEGTLQEDKIVNKPVGRRKFISAFQKQKIDVLTKKYSGDFALDQLLEDPTKKISSATGPLSKIWRRILADREVDKSTWKAYATRYQRLLAPECDIITGNETPEELKAKSKKRSNMRGNITDELLRPSFTIDVLMKGLIFIGIEKIDISIKIKRLNHGNITTHTLKGWLPKRLFGRIE